MKSIYGASFWSVYHQFVITLGYFLVVFSNEFFTVCHQLQTFAKQPDKGVFPLRLHVACRGERNRKHYRRLHNLSPCTQRHATQRAAVMETRLKSVIAHTHSVRLDIKVIKSLSQKRCSKCEPPASAHAETVRRRNCITSTVSTVRVLRRRPLPTWLSTEANLSIL